MVRDPAKYLAPGFRFHPTDEELVRYYLKRKVTGKLFRFDHISEVDVYKSEPWDLPGKSKLKSRDLEWYFFSVLDKKYGNGSKTNRATEKGYWKITGKDRPVRHYSRTVGMKKTLVYHSGRAPKGARTNWVMHEYRLVDEELEKAGIAQDAVICRIFQKTGSGPKNGEQYGVPFVEEEWEDDDVSFIPGSEAPADEVLVSDGACVEVKELDQLGFSFIGKKIFQNFDAGTDIPSLIDPLSLRLYYGETSNNGKHYGGLVEDGIKPLTGTEEAPELGGGQTFLNLPEQCGMDPMPVKDKYFVETSNNGNPTDYFIDEQFLDATENLPFCEGLFLEADDLTNPILACASDFDMVDEYLNFVDVNDDNIHNMAFDPSEIMGTEDFLPEQFSFNQKLVTGETEQMPLGSQQLSEAHDNNEASSSKQMPEATKLESDSKYPFLKQASQMLGGIPAPPAFASEFPSKDVVLQLNSVAPSSSSVHVTAGIIRIRNVSMDGMHQSFDKNADIALFLSFGLSQPVMDFAALDSISGVFSGKTVSSGWFMFMFMFIWVMIFSVSFKIGSYIYTR